MEKTRLLRDDDPPPYLPANERKPGQLATKLEIFVVAAGWLVATVAAVFYTAAIANTMELPYQPFLSTSSIPRAVTWNGTFSLVYVDLALAAATTSACNGSCLLDPFDLEATAQCVLPTDGLVDHFQQLFFRVVTFNEGYFVSSDMSVGLSYGTRLAVVAFAWGYSLLSFIHLVGFSGVVLHGGRPVMRRDAIVYHPMFNVVGGVGACLLFTFGAIYSMVLNGEAVMNDLILSAVLTNTLFLTSLILESRKGLFFSVAYSQAYDHSDKEDKPGRPHFVHHLTLTSVVLLFISISVVAIIDGVQRAVSAYNYGWLDPGFVTAYNGAVVFGGPYMATTYATAYSVFSICYLVAPALLPMISVFEVMNHAQTTTTATFATYVRQYRIASLLRQLLKLGLLCLTLSVPPISIPPTAPPACSA